MGDKSFEEFQREQRMLESASPHEYISYFIGINSRPLLIELRLIKWLLVAILLVLMRFATHFLPSNWWYTW